MKHRLLAVLAVVLLAVAGLSGANAASLDVNASDITVASAQACTTETISVTRTQRVFVVLHAGVRLSGIPESCQDLPIRITAGNGEAEGTSTGASGATLDIDMDGVYWTWTTDFHLVIDGWYVPAVRV